MTSGCCRRTPALGWQFKCRPACCPCRLCSCKLSPHNGSADTLSTGTEAGSTLCGAHAAGQECDRCGSATVDCRVHLIWAAEYSGRFQLQKRLEQMSQTAEILLFFSEGFWSPSVAWKPLEPLTPIADSHGIALNKLINQQLASCRQHASPRYSCPADS